jgi:hypothetical protein
MPEQYDKDMTSFTFSLKLALEAKKDISEKVDMLSERIDRLVEHFTIEDIPIIKPILNITHSRKELKKLAKALDRVADIIEHHDALTQKLKVIELAEKEPNWFAAAFGDFQGDIDSTISDLLS